MRDCTTREYIVYLIVALAFLLMAGSGALFRGQAPAPSFYYPDPTPQPVYHTEINIGSHNCIGWNVSC